MTVKNVNLKVQISKVQQAVWDLEKARDLLDEAQFVVPAMQLNKMIAELSEDLLMLAEINENNA